jgi:hypothetical protein
MCTARISIASTGGGKQLSVVYKGSAPGSVADDITAMAWLSPERLVYTGSPIYGTPGLFLVECDGAGLRAVPLVAARTRNSAYPNGADFFELKSVNGRRLTYFSTPLAIFPSAFAGMDVVEGPSDRRGARVLAAATRFMLTPAPRRLSTELATCARTRADDVAAPRRLGPPDRGGGPAAEDRDERAYRSDFRAAARIFGRL